MSIVGRALEKLQRQGFSPSDQATGADLRHVLPRPPKPSGPKLTAREKITIDFEQLRNRGVIPPTNHWMQIADEYRRIKRPLLLNALGAQKATLPNGNLIMVASALPADGKTFTSLNLAFSIAAEPGQSIVLVDADVRRCSLSKALDLEGRPGLIDFLADERVGLSDVLIETDMGGLMILPAGASYASSGELISGKRMEAYFGELAQAYPQCIFLFDSSPLLATSEGQVLAGLAGQIILVVRADRTPVPAVEDALSGLNPDKSINVVLNQARMLLGQDYHGGYY